jgi:hypothetical protein
LCSFLLKIKSLSQVSEKGLKIGQYQPDSLGRANDNVDNNDSIVIHFDSIKKAS